jgi:transcription elongation factor Elf1
MITPVRDPQSSGGSSNAYSCRACNVQYCTNCMLTIANGVETTNCLECERNFALNTDNSTGTPV